MFTSTLNLLRVAVFSICSLFIIGASAQSTYPDRVIRIVTPFPPGASTDLAARLIAEKLGQAWGQQVIVENRPGGNTVIGTQLVARAEPDGYTLLVATNAHTVTPLLISAPYDPIKDFAPLSGITKGEWVLVTHPSVPAKDLKEFLALLRAKPDQLNYATSGSGGASHLATEHFSMLAGVKARHIPYKGGSAVIPDLLAGEVQFTFAVPVAVIPHVQSGKLRALAVSGDERLASLPQVPTLREAGLDGFNAGYWIGALAPAGTPEPILNKLSAEIKRILETPEALERLARLGTKPFATSRTAFAEVLARDAKQYGDLVKAANIKLP